MEKREGRSEASIPKTIFPRLLKALLEKISENAETNIISGFRKTGIIPLNKEEVLKLLPKEQLDEDEREALNTTMIDLLKEMRYSEKPRKKNTNKKLSVEPGKSVQCDSSSESDLSLHEDEMLNNYADKDNVLAEEDFYDSPEQSANEINATLSDDNSEDLPLANWMRKKSSESPTTSQIKDCNDNLPLNETDSFKANCDFSIGDWVLVKFPVERKTACIKNRVYIGKIISILDENFVGSFLRKKESNKGKPGPVYYYPNTPDDAEFNKKQIIKKLQFFKERRGLYTFQNVDTNDFQLI